MSMYNRKTLMGCLPLVASMMGRTHGVRITIGGDTAFTTPDRQINLPELPLDMSEHDLKMTRGYLDHECGHQRDTDFQFFALARNPFLRDLLNYIEDIRIERKMAGIYPGSRDNFDYLNHALYDEPFKLPALSMRAALIPAWICNSLYGLDYPKIQQRADEVGMDLETAYPGLISRLQPLIQEADACQSTQDAYDVAQKILNILKGYMATLPRAKSPATSMALEGKGKPGQSAAQQGGSSTGGQGGAGGQQDGANTQSLQDMLNGNHRVAIPRSTGERLAQLLGALSNNTSPYAGTFEVATPETTSTGQLSPWELSGAKAATRVLATRLRGLLQTMTLSRFTSGRRGKVDGGRLHRIAANNPKVFSRQTPSISTDTLVHILMDRSGSMGGCISLACSACYAVAGALYPIKGVTTAVTVFPADSVYASLTELIRPGQAVHSRLATGVAGGTPMGQAVWWVLQQMIHQPQDRKILLIITDGVPDSHSNASKAFDMAKALNIEVHGIGIGDGAQRIVNLIPGSKIIHDIKELANAMFAILQKALTAQRSKQ